MLLTPIYFARKIPIRLCDRHVSLPKICCHHSVDPADLNLPELNSNLSKAHSSAPASSSFGTDREQE